jgi:tRNA (Thr-GGU) A37 N-methylase
VENPYDTPAPPEAIAAVASRIVLDPALLPGLGGLAVGGQVLVVFYFHKSEAFDPGRHLLQHPRGDQSRPKQGVFSLGSPLRPCPLGMTVVDLIGIDGNVLRVRGLDALNGTPVLDLKPA